MGARITGADKLACMSKGAEEEEDGEERTTEIGLSIMRNIIDT